MKILLTGATGYIGKRLLPILIKNGHSVVCCVRDQKRFNPPQSLLPHIEVIQIDLLDTESLKKIPKDIDAAYYLVHSMSSARDYEILEKQSAINFREAINQTHVQHVVYLSGIINESALSKHLKSRENVEIELGKGNYAFTCLRAGIIIGSGSASFEIMRDLIEKLPIMVTPRWLNTRCQPIGITDVITCLSDSLFNTETYNQSFDIGGPDILTYKEMLLEYARSRNLKRRIFILPFMTPKLSSYWLYFVTSTSYKLAIALVNSMKVEVVCRNSKLMEILNLSPLSYKEALSRAFLKIESNEVISSWKDSLISGRLNSQISDYIKVPSFGCMSDIRKQKIDDREACLEKIWRIGGKTGWYYADWLWHFRGYLDRLFGGVGLRRGRTKQDELATGDVVDLWRVLYANKEEGRLLLFAEMKLPGEAWFEFKISGDQLSLTTTFRPKGVSGRLYWYASYPLHYIIFKGMLNELAKK
ncbi:SDR family oxidoreductase [Ancylomarina sp.]|uniref:SDR family oxidoreductase n=1 Tax=Ancylomarina sp. TaxID=1970196 RepID=UPI00356AA36D